MRGTINRQRITQFNHSWFNNVSHCMCVCEETVLHSTCLDWVAQHWGGSHLTAAASPGSHCTSMDSRRRSRWSLLAPPTTGEWTREWTGSQQSEKQRNKYTNYSTDSEAMMRALCFDCTYVSRGSVSNPFPAVFARQSANKRSHSLAVELPLIVHIHHINLQYFPRGCTTDTEVKPWSKKK